MISIIVLIVFSLLGLVISFIIARAIITKSQIFGRPPIPVPFFLLAKMLVIVNLAFLLLKGLNVPVCRIFGPNEIIDIAAIVILLAGAVILILSTIRLNKDLIFGLSSTESQRSMHNMQKE